MHIGIDFGTTNSAVAVAQPNNVTLAAFDSEKRRQTFRSVLCFHEVRDFGRRRTQTYAGDDAIEHYLSGADGRFIQSLKSYLPSRALVGSNILGRFYRFEDLLSTLLRGLRVRAEGSLGSLGHQATVGRPVRFAGVDTPDDEEYALSRLRDSLIRVGFEEVRFEYEPVAAAYFYETRLDHDELILVGDFGGGTTDFTVMEVGRNARVKSSRRIIGSDGIGIAGDSFDGAIVRHLVSPMLGKDALYRSMDKLLTIPAWLYLKLERWHHLSFLKSSDNMNVIRSLRTAALDPAPVELLIRIIEEDLGFELHRAIQRLKTELSSTSMSEFTFDVAGAQIRQRVTRQEFENWISEDLVRIAECLDRLMDKCGLAAKDIDRVFLTGGSSFIPSIRRLFENRFGASKISTGSEFTSVAAGLALSALAAE